LFNQLQCEIDNRSEARQQNAIRIDELHRDWKFKLVMGKRGNRCGVMAPG
jgi:hypothetical protein